MDHFYEKIHGWFNFPDLYSEIISSAPDNFKFAEIGAWKGKSLAYFVVEAINSGKNFEVFAIDTFLGSSEHQRGRFGYEPLIDVKDGLYNHFLENMNPIKDKIKVMRESSLEAVSKFPDRYFDAVFIDASHDYNNVKNDLVAWFPKVKNCLYGHDIDWPGVKKAVGEFSGEKGLKYSRTSNSSWMICKT